MNTSIVSNEKTARTHPEVAKQRAEILSKYNIKYVLELCVGPSLEVLTNAYKEFNITCIGNDIESKWKQYYPLGHWRIGNALNLEYLGDYDAYVFAPPLTRGCTGKREDSLMIEEVTPSYYQFLEIYKTSRLLVLVLPARSIATKQDRTQFYKLINQCSKLGYSVKINEACVGRRQIRKYVELYLVRF